MTHSSTIHTKSQANSRKLETSRKIYNFRDIKEILGSSLHAWTVIFA